MRIDCNKFHSARLEASRPAHTGAFGPAVDRPDRFTRTGTGAVSGIPAPETLIVGVLFLIGTLVCAVTSNWAVFLVGRALQAVCLGIPAAGYGIVRDLLPRRWIPVAIGLLATGLGASAVAAPLIGGLLTDCSSTSARARTGAGAASATWPT